MAARRSSGVMAAWADAQRRQQRQREAQERAWRAAQEAQDKAYRAAARAQARDVREAWRAYQADREADAAARTSHVEAHVSALTSVLRAVLAAPPFRLEQLIRPVQVAPFNPGQLGVPFVLPDQRAYQVPAPTGMRALSGSARRDYEEARRQAQAKFEQDWRIVCQREEQRQHQLDTYHREYQTWAEQERTRISEHNAQVGQIGQKLAAGEPGAIADYFAAALQASAGWPDSFPRHASVTWDPSARELVVNWQLPGFSVVPLVSRYRYIRSDDRETQVNRSAGERKTIYRQVLAQSALSVFTMAFRADEGRQLDFVTVNGFVTSADPRTGRAGQTFLLTVRARREEFTRLELSNVDPVLCLEGLHGQLSPRPESLVPVQPFRTANVPGSAPADDAPASGTNLMDLDPIDFEDLVAELFRAMGMEVMTTQRSGDGGVDVRAMDPDPIRGGKLVIQVKRYRSTIPPAPVRDLYGTMLHEGAVKGILVTTAEFGPSAQEFAAGKPLTLIGGSQLSDLLARYGIAGPAPGAS